MLMALQNLLDKTRAVDFLGPLALRLYLAPVFYMAGMEKMHAIEGVTFFGLPIPAFVPYEGTIKYFGGLGIPWPELMAYLAANTEVIGAILLVLGLAVRWVSIPLMITMIVAAVTVHLKNGWLAIAGDSLIEFQGERVAEAIIRQDRAREILQEYGNYSWLTDNGEFRFVVLNNGIEFAATYFIMLLVLFFIGAGRFVSLDHWIARFFKREPAPS